MTTVPAVAADAAELPRVFYGSVERASITKRRMAGQPITAAAPDAATAMLQVASPGLQQPTVPTTTADGATPGLVNPPRAVRVEGVTIGREARRAVWIGGQRIVDGGTWGRYRVSVTDDGARLRAVDGSVRQVRVGMEVVP